MLKKAIYAGSFAPVHLGHMYVLEQACTLFDEVHVLLANNIEKRTAFSAEFCIEMLKAATKELHNIKLVHLNGLVAEYMQQMKIEYAVRGVRNGSDFEYEQNMAYANAKLYSGCKSIFIPTQQNLAHISSSLVRECLRYGKDISAFVPVPVVKLLQKYPDGK